MGIRRTSEQMAALKKVKLPKPGQLVEMSETICCNCDYSVTCGTYRMCDYYLVTGTLRGCKSGFCDKFVKRDAIKRRQKFQF